MIPKTDTDNKTKRMKYVIAGLAILATAFICASILTGTSILWGLAIFICGSVNGYQMCQLDYIKMMEKKQITGEEDNGLDGKVE